MDINSTNYTEYRESMAQSLKECDKNKRAKFLKSLIQESPENYLSAKRYHIENINRKVDTIIEEQKIELNEDFLMYINDIVSLGFESDTIIRMWHFKKSGITQVYNGMFFDLDASVLQTKVWEELLQTYSIEELNGYVDNFIRIVWKNKSVGPDITNIKKQVNPNHIPEERFLEIASSVRWARDNFTIIREIRDRFNKENNS